MCAVKMPVHIFLSIISTQSTFELLRRDDRWANPLHPAGTYFSLKLAIIT